MPLATAFGAIYQAKAEREQGKFEKAAHEYNARVAEAQAEATKQATAYEQKQFRKAGERHKAKQRAILGKAGLSLTGTSLMVLEETAAEIEKEAILIGRAGKIKEQLLISEAGLSRMKGRFARRAGKLRSTATLLSGGGRAGMQAAMLYGG